MLYIVRHAARGQLGIYGPRARAINNIDSRARSARVINVYLSHTGRRPKCDKYLTAQVLGSNVYIPGRAV